MNPANGEYVIFACGRQRRIVEVDEARGTFKTQPILARSLGTISTSASLDALSGGRMEVKGKVGYLWRSSEHAPRVTEEVSP